MNIKYEIAASVTHLDFLTQCINVHQHTIRNLSDNSATVDWKRKGASSTVGTAFYLLRLQALHQRHHHYIALSDFIPDSVNVMADCSSHMLHLSDTNLLLYFNYMPPTDNDLATVPAPQRNAFSADICLVQENIQTGIAAKHAKLADAHWVLWEQFCLQNNIDPFLRQCDEPVPILQVFTQRYLT
jgi:hypothetical protein